MRKFIILIVVLIVTVAGFVSYRTHSAAYGSEAHIIDKAGIIPRQDIPRFEQYMGWIMQESGVDIRMVFLPTVESKNIEFLAHDMMDQYHVGKSTGHERGLLLLYDVQGQRLKVEVGYGLEGWFPDIFIHRLVEDHARMFFASDNLSVGLRLMLHLLQERIREAVIHQEFDPRFIADSQPESHMSGGAGVSTTMAIGHNQMVLTKPGVVSPDRYPAGDTPEATYQTYLNWLKHWPTTTSVDFFTRTSQGYVGSFPLSPAYKDVILYGELGKSYKIVVKDDMAFLYFTGTPFVSPHFFKKTDGRWHMDLVAEVRNTHEIVGGVYTWTYTGHSDKYTSVFGYLLTNIEGYIRIKNGDNRQLRIAYSN